MMDPNRVIHVEGSGLLPPAYEPQIPADIRPKELVRVMPPSPPWRADNAEDVVAIFKGRSPEDHRYWYFGEAFTCKLPRLNRWEGDLGDPLRAGSGLGLERVPANTVLHFKVPAKRVRFPDLWEYMGMLVISDRLLQEIQRHDAEAIVTRPVIIKGSDGEVVSDSHVFADVVRNLAAIDLANSIVQYRGADGNHAAQFAGTVSTRIRDDLDTSFHLFRQKAFGSEGGGQIYISAKMRGHLDALKPKLSNIDFRACSMQ